MVNGNPDDPARRRAYRRELRGVARLLRYSGFALVALGLSGIGMGYSGAWWIAPSWASLGIGAVLILTGAVRRAPVQRKRTDGMPES